MKATNQSTWQQHLLGVRSTAITVLGYGSRVFRMVFSGKGLLGAMFVGGIAWVILVKQMKKVDMIIVKRKKSCEAVTQGPETDPKAPGMVNWLKLLDLDETRVETQSGEMVKLKSLNDYVSSLVLPTGVTYTDITDRILIAFGFNAMLPLRLFYSWMPSTPAGLKPSEKREDHLRFAQYLLTNLVAPVTISAVATVGHETAAGPTAANPMLMFQRGYSSEEPNPVLDREVFNFPEDLFCDTFAAAQEGNEQTEEENEMEDKEDKQETGKGLEKEQGGGKRKKKRIRLPRRKPPQKKSLLDRLLGTTSVPTHPNAPKYILPQLLPDLVKGTGKLGGATSQEEMAVNAKIATLLNRLAANALPGAMRKQFVVKIGEKEFTSPVTFVQGLLSSKLCSDVDVFVFQRLTAFGKAFSIVERNADDPETEYVPLCIPMRTGVHALDGEDIVTLMCHASIRLEVELEPSLAEKLSMRRLRMDWYQAIGEFVGWYAYDEFDWPWQGGIVKKWPGEKRWQALQHTTMTSVIVNKCAAESQLMLGGYGYTGLCLDSVGIVEMAVDSSCSVFPLLMCGQARVALQHSIAHDLEDYSDYSIEMRKALLDAVANLPSDVVIGPKELPDACRRLISSNPGQGKSVFRQLNKCYRQIRELQRSWDPTESDDKAVTHAIAAELASTPTAGDHHPRHTVIP